MVNLFQPGIFKSTSGVDLPGKIECDALTIKDWEWCGDIIHKMYINQTSERDFISCIGVPNGGIKLATYISCKFWREYIPTEKSKNLILVDDVWTTGKSMKTIKNIYLNTGFPEDNIYCYVVFARGPLPFWCKAIFNSDPIVWGNR